MFFQNISKCESRECIVNFVVIVHNFYVLLTIRLSIILDNDQLDAHLLYFTIHLL